MIVFWRFYGINLQMFLCFVFMIDDKIAYFKTLSVWLSMVMAPLWVHGQDTVRDLSAAEHALPSYTLEQCIVMALARSLDVENTVRDEQIARERIEQVRATLLPQVSANASYTRLDEGEPPREPGTGVGVENQYAAGLQLRQLLYSGGSVKAALSAAGNFRKYTANARLEQEAALVRDTIKHFYKVLFAEMRLTVTRDSLRQLEDLERQAEQKFKHQTLSEFEWLSARVNTANERPRLVADRNTLALERAAFRELVSIEEQEFMLDGELAYKPFEGTLEELCAVGLRYRPELRQAEANIGMRAADVRSSQSDYHPEIHLMAGYQGLQPLPEDPADESWDWSWSAGVTVSWAIFDGGLRRATVAEKRLSQAKAEIHLEDLKRKITLEIQQNYLTLHNALEIVSSSLDNIELAEKALEISRVRYHKGLATSLEFSDRNLALSTARLNYFAALTQSLQSRADLWYACGLYAGPFKEEGMKP